MERAQIKDEIEAGLERHCPGQWQALGDKDLKELCRGLQMGWRISVPAGSFELEEVDHLVLAVDSAFPYSQPRIFVPAAGSEFTWPHVEQGGLLCLNPSRNTAPIDGRVRMHLNDAKKLLNFSEARRRDEFEREFTAYWSQRATNKSNSACVYSLVSPHGAAREVVYYFDVKSNRYVIADDKTSLKRWLYNTGVSLRDKQIYSTWLIRPQRPWIPSEFPEYGKDAINFLPQNKIHEYLRPGKPLLLLFEMDTETGAAFAAVILRSAELKELERGFRSIHRVPRQLIVDSYANRPIERYKVVRADGAWIHGRDHHSSHASVKSRTVAIVGCGSIGASIAHLLAQAGVGELILIDPDSLASANMSRHLLGTRYVGYSKACSLRQYLQQGFPHLKFEHAFAKRFEQLIPQELDLLAENDLIISAGIDFDGESALDHWRRNLQRSPAHLSTWVEAYAVAGHAVLLYGKDSLLDGFDQEEKPNFRLTDWPEKAGALIVEAGCGNTFQPHGVVDLHPTIGMATSLALDMLLGKVAVSCRRVWMGDPSAVKDNGGIRRTFFADQLTIREFVWP